MTAPQPQLPIRFDVPLDTERVRLRLHRDDDLDAVHAVHSRADVCRLLPYPPRSRAENAERLADWTRRRELADDGDVVVLAIERRDGAAGGAADGAAVIGQFYVWLASAEHATAEVGWALHPDHAGRGFATEAGRAVLRALVARGIHRVVAQLDPRNAASIAVCRRLGMRREADRADLHWRAGKDPAGGAGAGAWESSQLFAILGREVAAREAGRSDAVAPDFERPAPRPQPGTHPPAPALPAEFAAPISTERLTLRLMTMADVDAVHAYQSREDVCRFLLHGPRDRERVAEAVAEYAAATRLEHDGDYWELAIERTADGRVMGHVYFAVVDAASAHAEIGWTLHPDFQGLGYATEAARAMLQVAVADLRMHRVRAELDPRNEASIALCRRLGMTQEAGLVEDLWLTREWAGTAVFALTAG